jgi:hypothetical protein
MMKYVDVQFQHCASRASKQVKVLAQEHWTVTQIESVARATSGSYDDYICTIPEYGYRNSPKVGTTMEVDNTEYIPAENHALWCEIKDHSFSAKDPNKMMVRVRGESRLACGPCTGGMFQSAPEGPKAVVALWITSR